MDRSVAKANLMKIKEGEILQYRLVLFFYIFKLTMLSVLYVLMVKSFMTNTRIVFLGVIARRSLARSFPSYVPFGLSLLFFT